MSQKHNNSGEIVIAIDDPQNRPYTFFPADVDVDSTFRHWRSGEGVPSYLVRFPNIPGGRIHIDESKRLGRITHGMSDPENDGLWNDLQQAKKSSHKKTSVGDGRPKEKKYPNLNQDDIKTWLFWMRRAVDNGWAEVVKGDLPTREEIHKRPGIVRNTVTDSRLITTGVTKPTIEPLKDYSQTHSSTSHSGQQAGAAS